MKKYDFIILLSIIGIVVILVLSFSARVYNLDNKRIFTEVTKEVYKMVIKKNEDDRKDETLTLNDYSSYNGRAILENSKSVDYVAKFDPTNNKLSYLCVSSGSERMLLEGPITLDSIVKDKVELTSKECEG